MTNTPVGPPPPPVPRTAAEYLALLRPRDRHRPDVARRGRRRGHGRRRRQLRVRADVGAGAGDLHALRARVAHRPLPLVQPARRERHRRSVPAAPGVGARARGRRRRDGSRLWRLHDGGHRRGVRQPVPRRSALALGDGVQRGGADPRVPSDLWTARARLQALSRPALGLVRRFRAGRRRKSGGGRAGSLQARDAERHRPLQPAARRRGDDRRRRRVADEPLLTPTSSTPRAGADRSIAASRPTTSCWRCWRCWC